MRLIDNGTQRAVETLIFAYARRNSSYPMWGTSNIINIDLAHKSKFGKILNKESSEDNGESML